MTIRIAVATTTLVCAIIGAMVVGAHWSRQADRACATQVMCPTPDDDHMGEVP